MATRPVLASHTGVRGVADNARNLSDDELRGIAATGGVTLQREDGRTRVRVVLPARASA